MGLPENQIRAAVEQDRPSEESVVVWPENATVVFQIWPEVSRYWTWINTGNGSLQISLDWHRIAHVTLADVPSLFARPDLKKRKARWRHIVNSLEIMEGAALNVFMEREKERQEEMKQERRQAEQHRAMARR